MSHSTRHDPERDAALYIGGAMRAPEAAAFEQHLMSCERCWEEVASARRGRASAESLRELAPQSLREDVRAAIAARADAAREHSVLSSGLRAIPVLACAISVVLVAAAVLVSRAPGQPAEVAAAIAGFRARALPASALPPGRAPDLSRIGLALTGSASGDLGDLRVRAFAYDDAARRPLVVYLADHPFPLPAGAWRPEGSASEWRARYDEVEMLCVSAPVAMMVLSERAQLLEPVARALVT
ncbi:MAG: hypothetical protein ABR552_09560 [Actinomycetota bacterium]